MMHDITSLRRKGIHIGKDITTDIALYINKIGKHLYHDHHSGNSSSSTDALRRHYQIRIITNCHHQLGSVNKHG
jgi:hypothetical protein